MSDLDELMGSFYGEGSRQQRAAPAPKSNLECVRCGLLRPVMLTMFAGEAREHRLCSKCWRDS